MVNCEKLAQAGIQVDELLKRLMGNDSLIKLFVGKFLADKNYDNLLKALAEGDIKAAEIASHTLKGMCGNMSLTDLFALFSAQVNLLRTGQLDEARAMMGDIAAAYKKAVTGMNEWLA